MTLLPSTRVTKEVVEEYRTSLLSVTALAKKYGFGYGTFFYALKNHFSEEEWLTLRANRSKAVQEKRTWKRPSKIPPEVQLEMVRLYESGLSCPEVGALLGIKGATVRQRLQAANVQLRPKTHHFTGPKNPTRGKKRPPEMIANLVELSRQRRGPKSSRWKGGVSKLNSLVRGRLSWWTQAVFKRDGYSCQDCGQLRGDIEAHHLIEFSVLMQDLLPSVPTHLQDAEKADFIASHSRTTDLSNGVTLCHSCHEKRHGRRHGKR